MGPQTRAQLLGFDLQVARRARHGAVSARPFGPPAEAGEAAALPVGCGPRAVGRVTRSCSVRRLRPRPLAGSGGLWLRLRQTAVPCALKPPLGRFPLAVSRPSGTTNNAPAWHFGAAWRFACFVAGSGSGSARLHRATLGETDRPPSDGARHWQMTQERAPGTLGSTELTNSDQKQTRRMNLYGSMRFQFQSVLKLYHRIGFQLKPSGVLEAVRGSS